MPDLLLELLCEEIPARMQARAAEDLRVLVTNGLVEAGLTYEGAKAFVTPRRLVLSVAGLPVRSPDTCEERKGPRLGAPDAAIQGFLKSAGLASLDQAKVQSDGKKGEFYVAIIERPGRPAIDIIAGLVPSVIRAFPWPKSMRWGKASVSTASLRWVRPLQSILCTFGPETEEPEIVAFAIDGIEAGNTTRGHRFLAPDAIPVKRFDDYVAKLEKAKVVLDAARRRDIIRNDAADLALAHGCEVIEDPGLLDEVAGLVEWPIVLMGTFEEAFLAIPPEVIRATIRANQKCFVLKERDSGKLANKFLITSNLEAKDGGKVIVAGNERVVRARLSDARYFWETDQKTKLIDRLTKLKSIVFHEKLGTQYERIERIAALAQELAPLVHADPAKAERAARLAKADLVTEMVGEFPELQGLMGKYYAELQGEDLAIAGAIEDHYKPQGPSDRVPTSPVAVAVALADKLDTLVGFWAIDEKPTGSKDPYALRRAALGVIRLVLENGVRVRLQALAGHHAAVMPRLGPGIHDLPSKIVDSRGKPGHDVVADLLAFFHDRLKVQLREQGARHDLVDAVLSQGATSPSRGEVGPRSGPGGGEEHPTPTAGAPPPSVDPPPPREGKPANDDLLLIVRRVEALGRFLGTPDGAALLAGYRRAANILRIEEKKDGWTYPGTVDLHLIEQKGLAEERVLAHALDAAARHAHDHVLREDFEGAMAALAELRPAVDAFFDKVLVNDPDASLRANRLNLLAKLRAATLTVADFAKVEG